MYGNPEVTTGGKALKFYASVRIDIRKGEPIKDGSEIIGNRVKIKVVKNKVAPPFKSCTVDMLYGEGISREGELLDLAAERGLINKSRLVLFLRGPAHRPGPRRGAQISQGAIPRFTQNWKKRSARISTRATSSPPSSRIPREGDEDEDDEDLDL